MKRIISLTLVICLGLVIPVFAEDLNVEQETWAEDVEQELEERVYDEREPEYTPNGTLITAPFKKERLGIFNSLIFEGASPSMTDEEFFDGIDKSEVIDADEVSSEIATEYRLETFATATKIEGDGVTKTWVYLNNDGGKIIRWRYIHKTPDFDIKYERTSDKDLYLTGNMAGAAVVEYLAKSMTGKYYTFDIVHEASIEVTSGTDYAFIPGEERRNEIAVYLDSPQTAVFRWKPYKVEITDSKKAYFLINGEKVSFVNNPESDYVDGCYIDVYGSDPGYFTLIAYYRDENGKEIARSVSYCVSTGV